MSRSLHGYDTVEEELALGARRVRLLRPRSADDLLDAAVDGGAAAAPYWAELWPAARVLADELARRDLRGSRVVELGCGLGLPSLAAALAGASVMATDVERAALAFVAANARRALGRRIATLVVDVADPPDALLAEAPFDLVIAADVLYELALARAIGALLPRLLAPDGEALVAFAWRDQERPLLEALAGWQAETDERSGNGPGMSARLLTLRRPA